MIKAIAYLNHGRWVADCPRPFCNNAVEFNPRLNKNAALRCVNCLMVAPVTWPREWRAIDDVTRLRPVPQTRNWFPKDHPLALASGVPHGQSVDDLIEENIMYGIETKRSR